jgi:hypothetical protein
VQRCRKPGQPDEIDLPRFCTLSLLRASLYRKQLAGAI